MFCGKCGAKIEEGNNFCIYCGAPLVAQARKKAPWKEAVVECYDDDEEVIDLSKLKNKGKPQEKAHKGTVITAIILAVAWILYVFLVTFYAEWTGVHASDGAPIILLSMACVCVPVTVIGLLIVEIVKKKTGDVEKLQKGQFPVFVMFSSVVTGMALVVGYSNVMSDLGSLVRGVSIMLFAAFLVSFVIVAILSSEANGRDGMYAILEAFFIGFIPAIFLGYIMAKIFAAAALLIVIGIIALFVFFANGGIIYYRR